jgi:hypothetical protein
VEDADGLDLAFRYRCIHPSAPRLLQTDAPDHACPFFKGAREVELAEARKRWDWL